MNTAALWYQMDFVPPGNIIHTYVYFMTKLNDSKRYLRKMKTKIMYF